MNGTPPPGTPGYYHTHPSRPASKSPPRAGALTPSCPPPKVLCPQPAWQGQDRGAHTLSTQRREREPHQPRVPDGDDEVEVRLQARLLRWGVLLHLSRNEAAQPLTPSPREAPSSVPGTTATPMSPPGCMPAMNCTGPYHPPPVPCAYPPGHNFPSPHDDPRYLQRGLTAHSYFRSYQESARSLAN